MSKNDIEPISGPIWPLAPQPQGDLALAGDWGQRSYGIGSGFGDLNLSTILRIASEWRWLILGAAAVAIAVAIVVTFLTTPQYRATAVLELNPPAVEILEDSMTKSGGNNDQQYLSTQYGLLASKSLAERVAQEMNLASNESFVSAEADRATRVKIATAILSSNFEVSPVQGSRLVRISYSSPSPDLAARITNSFADNFINANLERRYEASSYARQFLERQIATIKGDLEKSERELVAYAQRQSIINTGASQGQPGQGGGAGSDTASIQGASLLAMNQALAVAQARRIAAEQRYRQMSSASTTAEITASTAPMRQWRAQLEAEYQNKLSSFKPDYPDMVRLRNQIEALDQQIKREAGTVAGGNNASLLAEFQAAAAEERSLQERVEQLKSTVLNLRGRSIQYNILQREVDTNRSLYDALLQRYKEIGVAGGVGTNTVSVVDPAEPPGGPYKPNLVLNVLIGLLVGVLGGMGAALALEFVNDTIKTPDDVRDKLRLPSLGVIPKKTSEEALADELKEQTSPISEAYFSLRTSLQFTTETGAPKSLLITSTRAAEGKSSTTLALAQNFARLGNSVLLIDADLRKPAFVTGVDPNEGLSKLLTNSDPVQNHVLKTQVENLSLVPCGPIPPNPAELLASPRLKAIISEAMNHYDMVIVDGPPVLGLADAPLLSGVCRGTLLVVESGKTRTKAAVDAVNRLKAAGSHIVGAVLTKFRHQAHGYGYGYGYEPYKYGGIGSREREIKLVAQREG
ncbi:GumC family protein [Sphingosinicella rhizophila]|uniref:non-specific protein-tyrosine kinase n=1 Tax=Sphingosinicella rhizophila TaxID=3050082 RepID=A0ABU3Q8J2_9SPHN|nr:polysaccharide biosynthesis tyrosine autokinase [Sphingosinicella sp. GR2756]MDT9599701.1 polysaccharide biosynthesis tyrosine autokinase [Sphingosinicella sp. GR2756]